jgi:asparagine synthase (glutamine-hydrolysing)
LNGEIFNYIELRQGLIERGHRFSTQSDTEVIVHLYEELGPSCLDQLNGQFSFAVWDTKDEMLFLARDQLGICPLFYTISAGRLVFASEIKAILSDPIIQPELDPVTLNEIFTFWSPLSPHTTFKDILQLPPGQYLLCRDGGLTKHTYWELDYPPAGAEKSDTRSLDDCLEQLKDVFIGPHCVILPNVHVGDGAVIKAGTVLTTNVPEHVFWGANSTGPLA